MVFKNIFPKGKEFQEWKNHAQADKIYKELGRITEWSCFFPVVLATVSAAQYSLNNVDAGDCELWQGLILLCYRFFPTILFL